MDNSSETAKKVEQMGLRTVTGQAREGFFIPYRHADNVPVRVAAYNALKPLFARQETVFADWLNRADGFAQALQGLDGSGPERARFVQYWCPRLDAAMAYTLVRTLGPENIIEIGSGHSTRFMARAIADAGAHCAVTAIDPAPRAGIEDLDITVVASTLQDVDLEMFSRLGPGDFLCVDSSHILMPGTDVDMVFNRILPILPAGVMVFFHDIFLPYCYPEDWHWRGYNEQNAVGGLLQGGYDLVFASHYVVRDMAKRFAETEIAQLPLLAGAHECGLWLRKR